MKKSKQKKVKSLRPRLERELTLNELKELSVLFQALDLVGTANLRPASLLDLPVFEFQRQHREYENEPTSNFLSPTGENQSSD